MCDTYFSLGNLQGSSMETEVGWSTMCVPNKVKLAIFSVLLILHLISVAGYIHFTIAEFRRHSSWSWRKKLFILTTIGGLAETVLLILFINGVQSPSRYFLVPVSGVFSGLASIFTFDMFTKVFAEIVKDFQIDQQAKRIIKVYNTIVIFTMGLQFLLYGVLPIILYDNKLAVNAIITVVFALIGIITSGFSFVSAMVYSRLAKELQPSPDLPLAEELATVRNKVIRLKKTGIIFGILSLLTCLFPLWIIFTANSGNGLRGIFYVVFCYETVRVLVGANSLMYSAIKSRGKAGTSSISSQNERSAKDTKDSRKVSEPARSQKESSNFASFTIEELNGN